jgi:hypothetical protein
MQALKHNPAPRLKEGFLVFLAILARFAMPAK